MAADLIKKVQIFIEKHHMIKKGGRVLVGVSGGADSVGLLLVLHELEKTMGFSLTAVHVEHGIRGEESLADAAFTEKLCADLDIPFRQYSVEAPAYAGQTHHSVEEAARELRYACFAQACAEWGADSVAVAHHANDQAETMLFHLARGTGIRGLGGIAPIVHHHISEETRGAIGIAPIVHHHISEEIRGAIGIAPIVHHQIVCVIRPLLGVTRAEIEKYLNDRGQAYRVDSTNADMAYTRNRIRGRILPELSEVNTQAVAHMTETAMQLREICEYLEETALCEGATAYKVVYHKLPVQKTALQTEEAEMKISLIEKIRIFPEPFFALHRLLQSTLMHYLVGLIAGSEKDITSGHVKQVLELFTMREGKRTDLPYGISARRLADCVELYHREKEQRNDCEGAHCPENTLPGENVLRSEVPCERKVCREDVLFGENAGACGFRLDLPVPGELLLENGAKIRAEIIEFDGNFEKIPKKRYTKWMDYDKIKNAVQLRTRRSGDYLQIDAQGGRKKLKRYFIDEKIPVRERERALLVADKSHILWVVGHRISEGCKVTEETRRVLCLQYIGPQMPEDS